MRDLVRARLDAVHAIAAPIAAASLASFLPRFR
jgi:hypothetical protein